MKFLFAVLVGVVVFIITLIAYPYFNERFFSDPSIFLTITETKSIEIDKLAPGNLTFFNTQDGKGWITILTNIDSSTNTEVVIPLDLISKLDTCNNCSIYSMYIRNRGKSNANEIEINIVNDDIQRDSIVPTVYSEQAQDSAKLKCSDSNDLCILEISKLKPNQRVTIIFIGESGGINPQCRVQGQSSYCDGDYVDARTTLISQDFQYEIDTYVVEGDSRLIAKTEERSMPAFEPSNDMKCYKLDYKSSVWVPGTC